jgi:conjugative relaxase-like TrwC/TraI family protein
MFNMTKIRATNGSGKSFYANHLSSNDYYSEHERVEGYWLGELAEAFGLRGELVTSEEFSLFQRNINPLTMDKLTQRNASGGPRFFDFQVATPKSVSVMSMFDERLIEAHTESVRIAMAELERLAAVRVRDGENVRTNNYETTGKLVYAEFTHDTSRALDPQLHTHNVVCNVTKTPDGKYKALESLEMVRAIRYAGKVYHNEMAAKCRELGYETVETHDKKGNIVWYDLKGVSGEIMERFSKRRIQIEKAEAEFIAEHGRKPTLSENNELSVSTRSEKMKTSTREKVRELQMGQLSHLEEKQLYAAVERTKKHGSAAILLDRERTVEQVRKVAEELYERESVLKRDKILAEVLNRNLGKVDLSVLKEAVKAAPELRNLGGNEANPYYAPETVIERELSAIRSVEEQQGIFEAIAPEFRAFPNDESRTKQAELIHGLLNSKDRFNLFRGVAGAGKTSTLQEFCRGLRSGGVENIHLVAPTNSATDVLKQEGFEQTQTVAGFLLSKEKPPANSYVIIDESGLNSLREGVELLKLARANNYRVLFVGDARQHTAVESGDFFRLLEDYSPIRKFSLTDIHRQQNEEYRRGIFECAMGQFEQAFERFDKQRFIHEGKQHYLSDAAAKYMAYTENGRFIDRAILVTPTHEECDRLTDSVREKLKESDAIRGTGRKTEIFRSWNKPKAWLKEAANFQPGMTIGFIRNMKGVAKAGEVARVEAVEGKTLTLDNNKRIYARAASDFIDVGEIHSIELCEGDLIQFRVNLKDRKVYNGTLARVSADPGKVEVLYSDGKPRKIIDMPEHYAAFDYGWVTTSHKSQGRTAGNVVVVAESLDRKAFYVALSRGRKEMSLHCPDKEHLKRNLSYRTGERMSVHDLIRDREIPPDATLPLSEAVRKRKAELLPDFSYKDMVKRTKAVLRKVNAMLNNAAAIRRMRKHRERLFNEHTRFETEEHAVGLLGKVMGRIGGWFKAPEPAPETPDQAALERERAALEPEQARKQERNVRWKIFESAWAVYVDKRKEYHERFSGGGEFALTETEERYRNTQNAKLHRQEEPGPLPHWLEHWSETAVKEAEKSREALAARLEAEKRRAFEAAWRTAKKQWSTHIEERNAYHEERQMPFEFKLWSEEEAFARSQAGRRSAGLEPEAIPPELRNWHDRADEENRRMTEILRRQRAEMLRVQWKKFDRCLQKYMEERTMYQKEFHPDRGPYRLSRPEQLEIDMLRVKQEAGLAPEYPDWMRVDWSVRIEERRELLSKWAKADAHWEKYREERQAYQAEFYPGTEYRLSVEERRFAVDRELRRRQELEPESPAWLDNWRIKVDAIRQQEYEEESKWKYAWNDFEEKWSAHLGDRTELSSKESAFLRTQERRKAEHQMPPELGELPDWMSTEKVRDIHWRNLRVETIREVLELRPGDEEQPPGSSRRRYYESRKAGLFERIAEYDRSVLADKLDRWMSVKNPDDTLKAKIRIALYEKHGYAAGAGNAGLGAFGRHRMLEQKRAAEKEYAEYEVWAKIAPATGEQRKELEEFIKAGYIDSYPKGLNMGQAEALIAELWEREREVRRQNAIEEERLTRERRARENRTRELRAREAKSRSRGMDL